MAKTIADKIVSMVMEQLKKPQPPDKPVYFDNIQSLLSYIGVGNSQPTGVPTEMGEMANIKTIPRKLPEPLRIPISALSKDSRPFSKIVSKDPVSGELVEDVIIGDEVIDLPSGFEALKFVNYGNVDKSVYTTDKGAKKTEYVLLPENIYYPYKPRNEKAGTSYTGPVDLETAPENETPEEQEKRLAKIAARNEEYAKRYVIYPAINRFFSREDILNRLDASLIPETWAGYYRTERTTNKEIRMNFGGNGTSVDCEFYAVKDISNIDEAIAEIFRTRMDIEDGLPNMRKRSETKPREYANYIYKLGGNWEAMQRIYSEKDFKEAGEYTRILKLLKQNIQKGEKAFNTFSKLIIRGGIINSDYVLVATFHSSLNYRPLNDDKVKTIENIIPSITVDVRKRIPQQYLDNTNFSIKKNKDFYGEANKDNIFTELMKKLGEKMLAEINPDDVLTKISNLVTPSIMGGVDINSIPTA